MNDRDVAASEVELAKWKVFKEKTNLTVIPIPYAVVLGGVNIVGVFYLNDPVENSYTDGAAVGAIIGIYHLDKNKTEVKLYDPTENLLRLDIILSFTERFLKARVCSRTFTGGWSCSDYATLASW